VKVKGRESGCSQAKPVKTCARERAERKFVCPSVCLYERLSSLTQQHNSNSNRHAMVQLLLVTLKVTRTGGFTRRPCDDHVYQMFWTAMNYKWLLKDLLCCKNSCNACARAFSVSTCNSAHSKVTHQLPWGYLGPSG
jgi:hypothetical protein